MPWDDQPGEKGLGFSCSSRHSPSWQGRQGTKSSHLRSEKEARGWMHTAHSLSSLTPPRMAANDAIYSEWAFLIRVILTVPPSPRPMVLDSVKPTATTNSGVGDTLSLKFYTPRALNSHFNGQKLSVTELNSNEASLCESSKLDTTIMLEKKKLRSASLS